MSTKRPVCDDDLDQVKKIKVCHMTCNDLSRHQDDGKDTPVEDACISGEDDRKEVQFDIINCDVGKPTSEIAAGITEYVGEHNGFSGIIKQRYGDFLVTEIDTSGNLVRLDHQSIPEEENNLPAIETELNEETISSLRQLEASEDVPAVVIDVESLTKEQRRTIHELVRKCFANVESNTSDENGKKVIVVSRLKTTAASKKDYSRVKCTKGVRQSWPASRGNYLYFTLYKENVDTLQAINIISKLTGIRASAFTYAGVKDKRAKTSQKVSVYRTEAIKLLSLNQRLKNMMIGNVEYKKEPLRLGDLSGNRFHIVIRNVKSSNEDIERALTSLTNQGFVNYYGTQRFGTTSVPTHAVGLALLKGNWKLAVDLILKFRPGEDKNTEESRKIWLETQHAAKALAALKNKNTVEANLLRGLAAHGTKDLVNALNFIPRNMRLMYIHSYQSYLWNQVVSSRIKKFGLSVLEGDLVLKDQTLSRHDESEESGKVTPAIVEPGTASDYSVHDVVLPLVGYDVMYPKNEISTWYKTLLARDTLDKNNLRHTVKTYSLAGSYRRMMVLPKDVRWSVATYEDTNVPLIFSDYDKLADKNETENAEAGQFQAVKLEMNLPSSSYATMALREILRADTSPSFQRTLNEELPREA